MKKTMAVSLFFAAFFAATLTSCNGPLDGDYRTIHLNGFGEESGSNGLESANTPPSIVNTDYIVKELESKLTDLLNALDGKTEDASETRKLEVAGSTCTVTLRKNGEGYNVAIGGVDLRNEDVLMGLLRGMQDGIPDSKPIYLDFSDCHGEYMPSIIGKPLVDKTRFVSVILPDTVKKLYQAEITGMNEWGDDKPAELRTFEGFTNLKTVVAPGVTEISKKAFAGLNKLEVVNIPKAESIGESAFSGCDNLTTIDFPNVTKITDSVFLNCINLSLVNMPKLEEMGSSVFQGCTALATLRLPALERFYYGSNRGGMTFAATGGQTLDIYLGNTPPEFPINSYTFGRNNNKVTQNKTVNIYVPATATGNYDTDWQNTFKVYDNITVNVIGESLP